MTDIPVPILHGPGILEVPLVSKPQCEDYITQFQTHHWKKNSSLHLGEKSGALGANDHFYLNKTSHQSLELKLFGHIFEGVKIYQKYYQVDLVDGSDLEVIRYGKGGSAAIHADICKGVNNPVSALIYFNEDYKGGELVFPEFKLTIKPQIGSLMFFPGHFAYMHFTNPIEFGTKYVAYTTLHDVLMR